MIARLNSLYVYQAIDGCLSLSNPAQVMYDLHGVKNPMTNEDLTLSCGDLTGLFIDSLRSFFSDNECEYMDAWYNKDVVKKFNCIFVYNELYYDGGNSFCEYIISDKSIGNSELMFIKDCLDKTFFSLGPDRVELLFSRDQVPHEACYWSGSSSQQTITSNTTIPYDAL
jgi:hypothetical protein